jgi:hypothetical protein
VSRCAQPASGPKNSRPLITEAEIEIHAAFVTKELGDKNLWNA